MKWTRYDIHEGSLLNLDQGGHLQTSRRSPTKYGLSYFQAPRSISNPKQQ